MSTRKKGSKALLDRINAFADAMGVDEEKRNEMLEAAEQEAKEADLEREKIDARFREVWDSLDNYEGSPIVVAERTADATNTFEADDEMLRRDAYDSLMARSGDFRKMVTTHRKLFLDEYIMGKKQNADAMNEVHRQIEDKINAAAGFDIRATSDIRPDVPREGGVFMPRPTYNGVVQLAEDVSGVRSLARVVPLQSNQGDSMKFPVEVEKATMTWVGLREQPRAETAAPQFEEIEISLCEGFTKVPMQRRTLDRMASSAREIYVNSLSRAMVDGHAKAFVTGSGQKEPKGILSEDKVEFSHASRPDFGQVGYVKTGANGGFPTAAAGVNPLRWAKDAIAAIPAAKRRGARWLMSASTWAEVQKAALTDGGFALQQNAIAGSPGTFVGYPVFEESNMPELENDSFSIMLLAPGAYTILEDRPFTDVDQSPDAIILLRQWSWVGGALTDNERVVLVQASQ